MGERSSASYVCKTCNSMFFYESDVMAHKAMTGHYQFEKRNGHDKSEEAREQTVRELDDFGMPTKALSSLPNAALKELLEALKKAKSMTQKDS